MQRKRANVIAAAADLFVGNGFRKASMDEIARRAQVAKPTLYAYFPDKEALFAAVCEHLGRAMLDAARSSVDGKTLANRVFGILSAKFTATFELLRSSPYAQELVDTYQAAARKSIDATTAAIEAMLTREIKQAQHAGEIDVGAMGIDVGGLVRVLMQVGYGASYGAANVAHQKKQLRTLVDTLLRSE